MNKILENSKPVYFFRNQKQNQACKKIPAKNC